MHFILNHLLIVVVLGLSVCAASHLLETLLVDPV